MVSLPETIRHVSSIAMPDQLELFFNEPFSMRLKIEDAMHIFWEHYWKFLPCASATKAHKRRILFFFRERFIETISKSDIEAFRKWCKEHEKLGPSTTNKAHMMLSRMFTKLAEYKLGSFAHGMDFRNLVITGKNPCALVPRVNEKQFARKTVCTLAEWRRFMYYANDDMTDILKMLVYTGLRPCDLKRMTSNNIDLQRKRIEGTQNKLITTNNPSGHPYLVPITPGIADILLPRLARVKPGTSLFPIPNWQKRIKDLRVRAGTLNIQIGRDFRRTKIAWLLDNGHDPFSVMEGAGLQSLECMPNYAARTIVHQINSVEKLTEAFPG